MKIILAGGTGFVGRALRKKLLSDGHEVIVLTRQSDPSAVSKKGGTVLPLQDTAEVTGREQFVVWDGKHAGAWVTNFESADAVINLTGENIAARRWTPSQKQKILSSRVEATRAIVDAIGCVKHKPVLLINASAVGYYGDSFDRELTESSSRGSGFLAETCEAWESEARKAEIFGVRVVLARLGPVLGEKGGMLAKMLPPFLFFMGAPLGTGKQWIPWVHRDDVVGAFLFMLKHQEFSGPINITSGVPVTMKEFCRTMAKILHRPCWPCLPPFFLRGVMGEMATIVLSSQRAMPLRLLEAGYRFHFRDLSTALKSILEQKA